jgi:hypothetical protein
MKKCFKCNENKELTEFYRHKEMSDGHVNKCKDCNKQDVIINRKSKLQYYREYDKKRNSLEHRKIKSIEKCSNYRKENPKKYKAHSLVNSSIRNGKLKKPKICESCLSQSKLNAHHDDYDKPLSVRWLCSPCHSEWHKYNQALNQS